MDESEQEEAKGYFIIKSALFLPTIQIDIFWKFANILVESEAVF
jgi:hypothetical protein